VLLIAALVAALVVALRRSQTQPQDFHVSGFLEADEIAVGSRVGGRVARVHAQEGSAVEEGEVLVELEPFDLLERHAREAAEVAALEARLAALRAGPRVQEIEAARARLEAARAAAALALIEEDRTRALVAEAVHPQEALDRTKAELDSARADERARSEELGLLEEGTRPEDIAAAEAELAAARAEAAALERALEELTVRAPLAATVEACDLQPGDLVAANAAMTVLRARGELYVRAYVPQNRLTFTVGAPAEVGVDAFPGRRFAAEVTYVAPRGEFTPSNVQTPEQRSQVVVRVRVRLLEGANELRPGVAADVWFPSARGAKGR
jgi:multidrug resistance efflux pump